MGFSKSLTLVYALTLKHDIDIIYYFTNHFINYHNIISKQTNVKINYFVSKCLNYKTNYSICQRVILNDFNKINDS